MGEYDEELISSYIQESKEHLASIETDLVELERQGAEREDALINKIFRAAHSIKGGAGFFDFKVIKELAHKLENVLDLVRAGKMAPNPEIVTMLLRGFDRLSELVDAPDSSEQADISDELVGLIGLASEYSEEAKDRPKAKRIPVPGSNLELETDEAKLARVLDEDRSIMLLRFDLVHDVHRLGRTPLDVVSLLVGKGEILDSAIDILSVGTLDSESPGDDVPYFVLYATSLSLREIVDLLEIPLAGVTILDLPRPAKAPQPPSSGSSQTTRPPAPEPRPASSLLRAAEEKRAPSAIPSATKTTRSAPPRDLPTAAAGSRSPALRSGPAEAEKIPKEVAQSASAEIETVRVSVGVLDDLMNLSGELVLVRNELADASAKANAGALHSAIQRMSAVTGEMQDAVMRSRMQPASNLFSRYQRTVRDLARDLGKEIDLRLSGKDTELDRSLIESLSDPLNHLVRNACDHGIETPEVRLAAGKGARGLLSLSAAHEAGQVVLIVEDDGKGIDPEAVAAKAVKMGLATQERAALMSDKEKLYLITLPGLSTAASVSDLSGRGVGMDVVKANVDRLGGRIDITSAPGKGTQVRITLPLTLSVIPALLAGVGEERFALPQAAAAELLHIRAGDVQRRIEKVGDRPVLVLRGEVIPLVRLADAIGMERVYDDDGRALRDRRERVEDRRSSSDATGRFVAEKAEGRERSAEDRRFRAESDYRIIVVRASGFRYGMIVDQLFDTTEIVVKPLGRHLKKLSEYSGATILGDGAVALILDPAGLALKAGLTSAVEESRAVAEPEESIDQTRGWLLFRNGVAEQCAMPLEAVERVMRIQKDALDSIGDDLFLRVGEASVPVFSVASFTGLSRLDPGSAEACVLIRGAGRHFGFLASPPVDSVAAEAVLDERSMRKPGVSGTAVIRGQTTVVIDPMGAIATLKPEWFEKAEARREGAVPLSLHRDLEARRSRSGEVFSADQKVAMVPAPDTPLIVVAEDSDFFRTMVVELLQEAGYRVIETRDGFEALETVRDLGGEASLVVTDIEMPRLDGRSLALKLSDEFPGLPLIALSSLASEADEKSLREAGALDYLVKLDRDELLASVASLLDAAKGAEPEGGGE